LAWLILRDVFLFAAGVGGLALPWLPLLQRWPAAERAGLALAAALLTGWLAGFGLYAAHLPLTWFWALPALGALALWLPAVRLTLCAAGTRALLARWALVAAGCLGWQMMVVVYSGAAWQIDCYEHFDRAHFFLDRWPLDVRMADIYPLPARPPLVNLWAALFLSASGGAYFHYQVFMTLLGSLTFFPLAQLVDRWSGGAPRAHALLPVVLLACPLFVQNATFPWTKLPAAFFVLLAWAELTAHEEPTRPARLVAAAALLAGGLLAHYSTGPWILALAAAWLATRRAAWREPGVRRGICFGFILAAVLLASWIGWSAKYYGLVNTFTQNTTLALGPASTPAQRLTTIALNLFHTLCPVSLVGLDHPLLAQTSALGRWRDGWFILYQLRLWWTFGIAGGFALAWLAWRRRGLAENRFAWIAVPTVIIVGIAVVSERDTLGLAHVALQPLVLLGLAWLVARVADLPAWLRRLWAAGLVVDFVAGILFHFLVQSGWPGGATNPAGWWNTFPLAAAASYQSKQVLQLVFLADRCGFAAGLGLALLATGVALFVWDRIRTASFVPGNDVA